ncbi:MAG: hypothetical protein A3G34_04400 [Candidatus Lindowbacteria bacterium RIFCSPLOWO2_12_FULL_62_27]|nr:MAG: hypothetical protein A3G34_04400 [Candidatus Lindowbacteria bacterium RIFCSPLOWO2_12_FULL_62_27]
MKNRRDAAALLDAVREKSFTPSVRDVDALIELLKTANDERVQAVQNAILRVGRPAAACLLARLPGSTRPVRGHLVKILGRIGQVAPAPDIRDALLALLYDEDLKTRRNAVLALGRMPLPGVEDALLQKWAREDRIDHRRSIAASLGKIGGEKSLDALRAFETKDAELKRIIGQAALIISRNLVRNTESTVDGGVAPSSSTRLVAHCRAGLEKILTAEFGASWQPQVLGCGAVGVTLRGPLESIFSARTFLNFGMALPPVQGTGAGAVVAALTQEAAMKIFKTWTCGLIRYRIEWAGAGPRRAAVWNCVKEIAARRPELINDPADSTWEAVVHQSKNETRVDLHPKKLPDPRFAYRLNSVYASSHPTLAAALARVAGPRPDDVVWDPFAGAGTELVERALAGSCRELHGTDIDPRAIEVAERNLKAAGIHGARLRVGDALTEHVPGVTLILTDPPMGRRSRPGGVGPLLKRFIEHAAETLAPGGRFVWISPLPEQNAKEARTAGLELNFHQDVDMGGFRGQIQKYEKK